MLLVLGNHVWLVLLRWAVDTEHSSTALPREQGEAETGLRVLPWLLCGPAHINPLWAQVP